MSSEDDFNADPASDEGFGSLTDRLGSAFTDQADRFEPSHNAYAKVAEAVTQAQQPTRATGWLRPLAAAAAVAGVVGVGGIVLSTQGSQSVGTGPGDSDGELTASTITAEPTTTLAPPQGGAESSTTGEATSGETESDDQASVTDAITGPVRATQLGAAQAFLDQLRLPFGAPEMVDGQVIVRSFEPGAEPSSEGIVAAELRMVEVGGGFAVAEATSDSVIIDEVGRSDPASPLAVSGSGTGFEATLDIQVMSALDNRVLADTYTQAGNFGELGPYSVELPVIGSEHAWVVVSSSGGADGVTNPFAARLVSYGTPADDATDYAVIGIAPDDVDGGLVVRSGPGTSNGRVGVIPTGSTGVRRNSAFPVAVGDDVWWSVSTPDLSGWVNSRFIASNEPVSDEALAEVASVFQSSVASGSDQLLAALPFTRRVPVLVGAISAPEPESAARLFTTDGWSEQRSIAMPEVYGEPRNGSLDEILWTQNWVSAERQPGGVYSYPSDKATAETYFGNLSSIVIAPENPNSPWDRTFLFVEMTPDRLPEVVGMVIEVQQP